jgi:hypothetical protein
MTDLETRLRDGLHSEVDHPDVDRFLTDVRRGVAWRRGRRASVGVAVLVAGLIGGSVLVQQGRDHRTAPAPITHGPSPTATTTGPSPHRVCGRVVDLDTSGEGVLRLTWNLGCTACSSVWLRAPSGSWTHLADFEGKAAYGGHVTPRYGPVDSLVMAPNGRDGWADGRLLWATHDGGHTWSPVDGGPGTRTIFGRDVAVGTHVAWATRRGEGHVTLWRTDVGSDVWQRVDGVPRLHDFMRFSGVTHDDRVALQVSGEGGSGNALVVGSPGGWSQIPVPFGVDVNVRTDGTTFWASIPEPRGLRMFRLEHGTWRDLGRFVAQNWFPLDGQRVLLDRPTAAVFTDTGVVPSDLHPGARILGVSRATDGTFWLLTMRGRVYTSIDALHWTLRP